MIWPAEWRDQMVDVNAEVNLLPYVTDAKKYQLPEFWASIDDAGSGDCEDYAIAKLRRLQALGWPIEALHLACCYVETGEYHAVLVVDTPEGAFILDNRRGAAVSVDRLAGLNYRPDVIQAAGGQRLWKQWLLSDAGQDAPGS